MANATMAICTLNNPEVDPKDYLEAWSRIDGVVFVTGQLEKGEEGTPHVQYFVQLKRPQRISWFKKHCSKSHVQFVKKNNGADEYCNKEDTRLDGPWTFGVRPARRDKAGDVKRHNEQILELGVTRAVEEGLIPIGKYRQVKQSVDLYKMDKKEAFEAPDVRGTWIWGPPGVGKSRYARENFKNIYTKAQNKWFDGYNGEDTILLDDHDNPCLGHQLKIWTDRYAIPGEVKGGNVPLMHRDFVVTSNYAIRHLYKDAGEEMIQALERRFKVIHMTAPFMKKPTKELSEQSIMGFE